MKRVVIIGAGGHGNDVAEIIRDQARSQGGPAFLGFVVDSDVPAGKSASGPILGDWSWFDTADRNEVGVVCAVGDPALRKRFVEKARSRGLFFASAVSPTAKIVPSAVIGNGVMVFPQTFISRNVRLADHTVVNAGSTVGHDTTIECYGTLAPGVHLAGNVSIGEGCQLGIGSSVIPRRSIGAWTIIGAGAVVIGDIPDQVTAVGVPARVIKTSRFP